MHTNLPHLAGVDLGDVMVERSCRIERPEALNRTSMTRAAARATMLNSTVIHRFPVSLRHSRLPLATGERCLVVTKA
jgi:hypothetical protein